MKKFFLTFIVLLTSVLGFAQSETGEKETVYIDYFSNSSNIKSSYVETLRTKIIEGLTATQRINVIDVASNEILKEEAKRRQETSAMGDVTARKEEMSTLGAGFLIQGHVTSLISTKKTTDEGKVYYESIVKFTLKVIKASTGTLKATESFENKEREDTYDLSIAKCLNLPSYMMKDFVDRQFKVQGEIIQFKDLNKKGNKAESVYINLGEARGVQEGQPFIVYNVVDIAGELSKEEVGRIKVSKVMSANRSICKVTKGGEKIYKLLQGIAETGSNSKLIIESDEESLVEGFTNIFK